MLETSCLLNGDEGLLDVEALFAKKKKKKLKGTKNCLKNSVKIFANQMKKITRKQKRRREMPKEWYHFNMPEHKFMIQESRALQKMRKSTINQSVSSNNQFVYNAMQETSTDEMKVDSIDILNDVFYSHSLFPNSGIEWNLLFSVITYQTDDYVCPICLFKPVAPRITKCGHIFCADCIKQFFDKSDNLQCPICSMDLTYNDIVRADLRFTSKKNTITFKKVIRNHYNCCCFEANSHENHECLPSVSSSGGKFSRFMIADTKYMKDMISSEIESLIKQKELYLEENIKDDIKISYIQKTYEDIASEKIPDIETPMFFLEPEGYIIEFYQEESGQLIFLDHLSKKILCAEFGSIKEAPNEITVQVLNRSNKFVNQRFKTAHPTLAHLPDFAQVEFVLADLSNVVSPQVLEQFQKALSDKIISGESDNDHSAGSDISQLSHDMPVQPEIKRVNSCSFNDDDFPLMDQPLKKSTPILKSAPSSTTKKSSSWMNLNI